MEVSCWQDCVNGVFQMGASFSVLLHIMRIVKDKEVKGISVIAVIFFTSWGGWNLYYYPFLSQWFSFVAGFVLVIMNVIYTFLLLNYLGKLNGIKNLFKRRE